MKKQTHGPIIILLAENMKMINQSKSEKVNPHDPNFFGISKKKSDFDSANIISKIANMFS